MGIQSIMDNKLKVLELISKGLDSGKITEEDLQSLLESRRLASSDSTQPTTSKVSAVDIMFYIAGVILFAAIAAMINQLWEGGIALRVGLSAGVGLAFWSIALILMRSTHKSDIKSGLTNSLLLTGSFSVIYGGFIITSEFVNFNNQFHFYAVALTLLILGVIHMVFGQQIKRDILGLIGLILSVAAFPFAAAGILESIDPPMYVYSLLIATAAITLAYSTRVTHKIGAISENSRNAFDPLSSFVALMALYIASFDSGTGIIWLLVLVAAIIGLFYFSITMQDKFMLGSGSFFLVLAIITISYRYFSGGNIAISLMISAVGLIGTAVMATTINRRYIK